MVVGDEGGWGVVTGSKTQYRLTIIMDISAVSTVLLIDKKLQEES